MTPKFSLDDLLAKCSPFPPSEEEVEWNNMSPTGGEVTNKKGGTMKVQVFSKSNCQYCVMAKQFLTKNEIAYEEINLDDEAARLEFYQKCGPGIRSMPQIFVDDVRLGGYQDLMRSDILVRKAAGTFGEEF